MKRMLLFFFSVTLLTNADAQQQEARQLLLNWEKLTQLKQSLQNMYKGYQGLDEGYTRIRDIASGNFHLHQAFLDSLLQVSPVVKKYYRVAEIIRYQKRILEQGKEAARYFKNSAPLSVAERRHLERVYSGLIEQCARTLDDLLMVLTPGTLRLGDGERLATIDLVYERVVQQWRSLHLFTESNRQLVVQRLKEAAEIMRSRKLYGSK